MANKMQKYIEERERNSTKIAQLKDRNTELDRKIVEIESLEIRALMHKQNITLEELMALARAKQDGENPTQPLAPVAYAAEEPKEKTKDEEEEDEGEDDDDDY